MIIETGFDLYPAASKIVIYRGFGCSANSVTRIGEILPLWQHLKRPVQFVEGLFNIWHHFEPTLAIYYAIRQIFIAVNGLIYGHTDGTKGHIFWKNNIIDYCIQSL